MLVSDLIEIPHEKLADWIALIGSALAYLVFAMTVFHGLRMFVNRTRMRLLGNLIAAMVLTAGLVGYSEFFVALDTETFGRAVTHAFAQTPAGRNDALLKRLSEERARTIRGPFGPIDLRQIGFYLLPVIATAVAAMTTRARPARIS